MKRLLISVICSALLLSCFAGCADEKTGSEDAGQTTQTAETAAQTTATEKPEFSAEGVTVKDGVVNGEIVLELYPDKAPITVQNFIDLANEGFYNGLTFHRIYQGFMIQGGDPDGDGSGGSSKEIKGEFEANGVENDISHKRGVISMARSDDPDSASSQFFICHADSEFLDGNYAAFGKVVEGMNVVDALAVVDTQYNMFGEKTDPIVKQYMKTIEVIENSETAVKVKITVGK